MVLSFLLIGEPFPETYIMYCKKVYRYVFHVIAHMYHAHFKQLLALGLHAHLNLVFQHFIMFARHHNLIDDKETEVLDDLYDKLDNGSLRTPDLTDKVAHGVSLNYPPQTTEPDVPTSVSAAEEWNADLPPPPDSLMYQPPSIDLSQITSFTTDVLAQPMTFDQHPSQVLLKDTMSGDHNKENNSFLLNNDVLTSHNCVHTSQDHPSASAPSPPPLMTLAAASAENSHHRHHGSATGVPAVS